MNDTKKTGSRIELKNLRLRVYKIIVLMLAIFYLDNKYHVLGGKDVWDKILMILIGLAVLGEIVKFFDQRREKAVSNDET